MLKAMKKVEQKASTKHLKRTKWPTLDQLMLGYRIFNILIENVLDF